MKEKKIKLSTVIYICIIIILILAIVGIYIKYNNEITKQKTNCGISEYKENNNITEQSNNDFDVIYQALKQELEKNKSQFVYNNKTNSFYDGVQEICITDISIEKDKYFLGDKFEKSEYTDKENDDNLIVGSCKFALKLDTTENMCVMPSGDSETIGNWIIDNSIFVFNKTTQTIELGSSL